MKHLKYQAKGRWPAIGHLFYYFTTRGLCSPPYASWAKKFHSILLKSLPSSYEQSKLNNTHLACIPNAQQHRQEMNPSCSGILNKVSLRVLFLLPDFMGGMSPLSAS